jgi:hypothetical protein
MCLADGIPELPCDRSILAAFRSRISLAQKIEAAEHRIEKKQHDTDWFIKTAQEADIDFDM